MEWQVPPKMTVRVGERSRTRTLCGEADGVWRYKTDGRPDLLCTREQLPDGTVVASVWREGGRTRRVRIALAKAEETIRLEVGEGISQEEREVIELLALL